MSYVLDRAALTRIPVGPEQRPYTSPIIHYYMDPRWRGPSPYYDMVRNAVAPLRGLGAVLEAVAGLGRVSPYPGAYDAARGFARSSGGPHEGYWQATPVITWSAVKNEDDGYVYAAFGLAKAAQRMDATSGAERSAWNEVVGKYRWAYDLSRWAMQVVVDPDEAGGFVGRLRGALQIADDSARALDPAWSVSGATGRTTRSRKDVVRDLQRELNRLGYKDDRGQALGVDGDFGRRSREALVRARANFSALPTGESTNELNAVGRFLAAVAERPAVKIVVPHAPGAPVVTPSDQPAVGPVPEPAPGPGPAPVQAGFLAALQNLPTVAKVGLGVSAAFLVYTLVDRGGGGRGRRRTSRRRR